MFSHVFLTVYAVVAVHLAASGEFGIDYATLLPLMGVGLFLFGLGAIPAGLLGDRWSGPGMMVVYFIGTGATAIITGLAQDTTVLWLGLSGIGLFSSIYHPVGIAWLARNRERRGWVLGFNGMLGNFSIGLTPPLTGVLIDFISWRAAFVLPGVVCLLLGVALLGCVLTNKVQGHRLEARQHPAEASSMDIRRAMLLLPVAAICSGFIFYAMSGVMPKFVADSLHGWLGDSMTAVGFAVAPMYILGAFAQLLGGLLADRYSVKWVYAGCWGFHLLALASLASIYGAKALPFAVLAVTFSVMSLPAENVMYARFSPPAWRSTFYGIKFVLAGGVGWPAVEAAGWLFGRTGGFTELFEILALAAALAFLVALALPRTPIVFAESSTD